MILFAAGGQASARPIMKRKIMSDRIFLLGGHDLEMQAIRELLDELRIRYADKNLVGVTLFWANTVTFLMNMWASHIAPSTESSWKRTCRPLQLCQDWPSQWLHRQTFVHWAGSVCFEYHPGPSPTIGRCQRRKVYPRNAGTRRDTSGGGWDPFPSYWIAKWCTFCYSTLTLFTHVQQSQLDIFWHYGLLGFVAS